MHETSETSAQNSFAGFLVAFKKLARFDVYAISELHLSAKAVFDTSPVAHKSVVCAEWKIMVVRSVPLEVRAEPRRVF